MRILFVAPEAAPYARTGGLGDVLGGLPRALAARGHEVAAVIPRYAGVDPQKFGLRDTGKRAEVAFPGGTVKASVHITAPAERLRYLFLGHPWFERHELYGEGGVDYRDNHKRFALLSAGALEAARLVGPAPDLVHAHDWQAALAPLILKRGWAGRPAPFKARCVFTVHNVSFQGLFPRGALDELGLPADLFIPDALEFYGQLALIKAGLVFADKLTTVSPTYAREIVRSPETGAGLDGLLRWRARDLTGILNGVDYQCWSPDVDPHLPRRYSPQDLSGKAECKAALQKELGLEVDARAPLCAAIGRLARQKGHDLLAAATPGLAVRGLQLVLLGQGEPALEQEFGVLQQHYPGRVSINLRFDDPLAHRTLGGADLLLAPSRSEPCGLRQLYALRYGTLPLARGVGGLADSILDAVPPDQPPGASGWGLRFDEASPEALLAAVDRMLVLWNDRAAWTTCMKRAMALDHSWDRAAAAYETLYQGEGP